jgi:predicted 3-demethylubiquinone-9 3-methyltransferase (glyoxalase superfamily)
MFLDMASAYPAPEFNWAVSIHIYCDDESEFDVIFNKLSQGGTVMMGPEPVAHFRKCAWVTDKFGVTWQQTWE